MRVYFKAAVGCVLALSAPGSVLGQAVPEAPPSATTLPATTREAAGERRPGRGSFMDYGPFLTYSVKKPRGFNLNGTPAAAATAPAKEDDVHFTVPYVGNFVALKGVSVGVGNNSAVCFDTDTLSLAGGWTGGFLDVHLTNLDTKADLPAYPPAPLSFGTTSGPGWGNGGSFIDSRPADGGPLPAKWAHYRGLYRNGSRVVFSYTVGDVGVLELDGSATANGEVVFTRTLRLEASSQGRQMNVCELPGAATNLLPLARTVSDRAPADTMPASLPPALDVVGPAADAAAVLSLNGRKTLAAVVNAPAGATWQVTPAGAVRLDLPPSTAVTVLRVAIVTMAAERVADLADLLKAAGPVEDPQALCQGGPSLWNPPVRTTGVRSTDAKSAYVVDSVTVPQDNPWKSWMRLSGVDFFADGRAAVCTWNGDIWIVSGLDDSLRQVTWKRFATGLYEPLGLRIVKDQIYVLGRDQITRLVDLNHDGEADYYENFCNQWPTSPIYHAFNLDLQTDAHGNFYFATCGNQAYPWMRMKGVVLKVSPDGERCEIVCSGLRAPNGLGIGPGDELTVSDNQGNWTPVDRINVVKPGGFYGFVVDPRRDDKLHPAAVPGGFDPPLCWIRYPKPDNSAGALVWADRSWGPLGGSLLCTSYGQSALLAVLREDVGGVAQGGVFPLPLKFQSGIMRARVNPNDGQVWVCGLKGWQTTGSLDGALERVRFTGRPANLPVALHVLPAGLSVTFSDPLDPQMAVDAQSYSVEQWMYQWTADYGSPEFKLSEPGVKGHDEVDVTGVKLSDDRKTVTLQTAPLKPVMQMAIEMHLRGADGSDIDCEIDNTINRAP